MLMRLSSVTRLVIDAIPYPSRFVSDIRIKLVLLILLFTVRGLVNDYTGLAWLLSVLSILIILFA